MPTTHEQAAAIVADQRAARDAHLARGPNLHGWATSSVPTLETVADVEQRIRLDAARAEAFRSTPRGRFLTCIDELEEVGTLAEAAKLRTLYNSSITLLNGPVADQAAIGECLLILNGIGTRTAREGIDALAELLVSPALAVAA